MGAVGGLSLQARPPETVSGPIEVMRFSFFSIETSAEHAPTVPDGLPHKRVYLSKTS